MAYLASYFLMDRFFAKKYSFSEETPQRKMRLQITFSVANLKYFVSVMTKCFIFMLAARVFYHISSFIFYIRIINLVFQAKLTVTNYFYSSLNIMIITLFYNCLF